MPILVSKRPVRHFLVALFRTAVRECRGRTRFRPAFDPSSRMSREDYDVAHRVERALLRLFAASSIFTTFIRMREASRRHRPRSRFYRRRLEIAARVARCVLERMHWWLLRLPCGSSECRRRFPVPYHPLVVTGLADHSQELVGSLVSRRHSSSATSRFSVSCTVRLRSGSEFLAGLIIE